MASRVCKDCPAPITKWSKTGRCADCAARRRRKAADVPTAAVRETPNGLEATAVLPVRSLEALLAACDVDAAVWEVQTWEANVWSMGWVDRARNEAKALPLWQVKARFVRKNPIVDVVAELKAGLLADLRAASRPRPARAAAPAGPFLFEFTPFDMHFGKLCWGDETVTNFDTDEAARLFRAAARWQLEHALQATGGRIGRILCVFGNDVAHFDGKAGMTTAGTRVETDSRYVKVVRRIVAEHREAIDLFAETAPVDVVVVPGNHDELTSFAVGEIIAAAYEKDARVTVNNGPRSRKYYEWGANLIGFAHGDVEAPKELPLAMAREMPEAWARCPHREWHLGHKHIKEDKVWMPVPGIESDKGVRVRRLSSLSAHDVWHTERAYMDRRACDSFLFHETAGFTANLSFNVDHFTGKETPA